ncbi:MAG: hypothetical protein WBX01_11095 [Nitrososphaeraceae archaeon]|jgi:hypothetical protein
MFSKSKTKITAASAHAAAAKAPDCVPEGTIRDYIIRSVDL